MPIHAKGLRRYDLHYEKLREAVISALEKLGGIFREYYPYHFKVNILPRYYWIPLFGEIMKIVVFRDGSVSASSQTRIMTMIFSKYYNWQRNDDNIEDFFRLLSIAVRKLKGEEERCESVGARTARGEMVKKGTPNKAGRSIDHHPVSTGISEKRVGLFSGASSAIYQYDCDRDRLREATSRVLQALGWIYTVEAPYRFFVDFPFTFFSYGEVMIIDINDDGAVSVYCKVKNPRASLDYGKNKMNINRFFKQLNRELGQVDKKPAKIGKTAKKRGISRLIGSKTGEPEEGALIDR